jgi:hypothetical protein
VSESEKASEKMSYNFEQATNKPPPRVGRFVKRTHTQSKPSVTHHCPFKHWTPGGQTTPPHCVEPDATH